MPTPVPARVVDISTPATASIVGGVDIPGLNGSITVNGSYAYVGDPFSPSGTGDDLQIVDISDPTAPSVVNSVPNTSYEVVIVGDRLYQTSVLGLRTFELSDPAAPGIRGSIGIPGGSPTSVDVSGDFAYVVDGPLLVVVDVSNPASSTPLGTVTLSGAPYGSPYYGGIALSGGLAVATDGSSFDVLDISNPGAPAVMGSFFSATETFYDVSSSGQFAYATTYDSLKVIDVADPSSPVLVSSLRIPGAINLAVSQNMACVATTSEGLQIVDISNPDTLTLIGHADIPRYCEDVAIAGSYAYVAAESAGLQIVDISTPASPTVVGHVGTPYPVFSVAVAGQYAYLGSPFATLYVADVSDPTTPVVVGSVGQPTGVLSVVVFENYVYTVCSFGGLEIIDVTNPNAPRIIGNDMQPDVFDQRPTGGVAVDGSFAYTSDGNLFCVIPTQCSNPVAVALASFAAQPQADGVAVTWTTSQAVDHAGFNLQRSTTAGGGYQQLNDRLIPSSGAYRFLDTQVSPGTTYFYRLEALDRAGKRTFFGPVSARMGDSVLRNRLGMSRPNPLGAGSAAIDFELGKRAPARLTIYDASGPE